jgi:hypothetical protein
VKTTYALPEDRDGRPRCHRCDRRGPTHVYRSHEPMGVTSKAFVIRLCERCDLNIKRVT